MKHYTCLPFVFDPYGFASILVLVTYRDEIEDAVPIDCAYAGFHKVYDPDACITIPHSDNG